MTIRSVKNGDKADTMTPNAGKPILCLSWMIDHTGSTISHRLYTSADYAQHLPSFRKNTQGNFTLNAFLTQRTHDS